MLKARLAMAKTMPNQDVVVEVLDARMPRSSENPLVRKLRGDKPCVKVLSKSDLADPAVTAAWIEALRARDPSVTAIAITTDRPGEVRARVTAACVAVARLSRGRKAPRVLVCGIPNVGKSTLVNTLAERKIAKTGDKPAVTKAEQVTILKSGIALSDNPGIMWPKIEDPVAGLRLAFGGAIPDTAIDAEMVALYGVGFLCERYPDRLRARYKLTDLAPEPADVLEAIGRRRGCLRGGGVVDRDRASQIVLHDFRSGALGRITLETPEDYAAVVEPEPDDPIDHAGPGDEGDGS